MSYPPLRGQSAADLTALDRLNILAEYAANHGDARMDQVAISVGDLLDLREALAGKLGEGFPTWMADSPGTRTLRTLSAELERTIAHEDLNPWDRARIQRWYEQTSATIGKEYHWRNDLLDVLDAGIAYAQKEEQVKPRHLSHERRLLGALFRLMDRMER